MEDRRVVMEKEQTNNIVRGAIMYTIAGLLSKVLSATYRIPLQNLTGDLGFYIYQQVYPLLGTVMILALYGFPVAISKLTAEQKAQHKSMTAFYLPLLTILMIMNGAFFVLLYVLAPTISVWIGDEQLVSAFRLAAWTFILIPFLALLRGVSQGHGQMKQTAYSQVVEQFIRVTIIIVASYLIFIERLDIYEIGEAGAIATLVGMGVAIILLILSIPKQMKNKQPPQINKGQKSPIPWTYYIKTCFTLGVLATFNHLILLLMQMVDMLTLVPSLIQYGLSSVEAMEAKGIFDRGQPLIQFGVVFGSAFALALIPNVIHKEASDVQARAVRDALLFGFYLAFGATIGLFSVMKETNMLLFTNSTGTSSLQILSLTIVLTSITITTATVLQSLGKVKWILYLIVSAVVLKTILNRVLVPNIEIMGSAIATVVSMFFLCVATSIILHKKLPIVQFMRHIRWGPLLVASSGMVLYILLMQYVWFYFLEPTRLVLLLYIVVIVSTGALLYVLLLLRYNVLTNKQIQALPFSTIILKWKTKVQKN